MYFETFEEAYAAVDRYIVFYNQRRFHGCLHKMSPMQYLEAWRANELERVVQRFTHKESCTLCKIFCLIIDMNGTLFIV
ncbi:MAG: IS3 family transposase [Gorillibacterium sp.]|nr:IS3 family transposase [Gorillibacterium sp.]